MISHEIRNSRTRSAFIFTLSFAFCALLGVALIPPVAALAQQEANPATVRLVIDYGSGVEKHWTQIKWAEGLMALDAMEQAKELPEPLGLDFDVRGKDEMAFIRSIDGLDNEGSGGGKRNWVFRVNGELATQSCGAIVLESGDVVRWTFAAYNMDDKDGD